MQWRWVIQRTAIEWVKNSDGTQGYTWNPVAGCLHNCHYCYARRMANRFGKTPEEREFKPVFHPERLGDPAKIKKPSTIFVCSMADMFGGWVELYWITQILEACTKAPQHKYLFLTKNPDRYEEFSIYPADCMLGITVTHGVCVTRRYMHPLTSFVSFEPLLAPVGFIPRDWAWVIVGAQTGPGAVKPERYWVQNIVNACQTAGTPVFLKNNLKDIWRGRLIQEMPRLVSW